MQRFPRISFLEYMAKIQALFLSIAEGDLEKVKSILSENTLRPDIYSEAHQARPIDCAVMHGRYDIFKYLAEDCQVKLSGEENISSNLSPLILTLVRSAFKATTEKQKNEFRLIIRWFLEENRFERLESDVKREHLLAALGELAPLRDFREKDKCKLYTFHYALLCGVILNPHDHALEKELASQIVGQDFNLQLDEEGATFSALMVHMSRVSDKSQVFDKLMEMAPETQIDLEKMEDGMSSGFMLIGFKREEADKAATYDLIKRLLVNMPSTTLILDESHSIHHGPEISLFTMLLEDKQWQILETVMERKTQPYLDLLEHIFVKPFTTIEKYLEQNGQKKLLSMIRENNARPENRAKETEKAISAGRALLRSTIANKGPLVSAFLEEGLTKTVFDTIKTGTITDENNVAFLKSSGFDFNAYSPAHKCRPIDASVTHARFAVFKLLTETFKAHLDTDSNEYSQPHLLERIAEGVFRLRFDTAYQNYCRMLERLLSQERCSEIKSVTPLHVLAALGRVRDVEDLLNGRDRHGLLPLHYAILSGLTLVRIKKQSNYKDANLDASQDAILLRDAILLNKAILEALSKLDINERVTVNHYRTQRSLGRLMIDYTVIESYESTVSDAKTTKLLEQFLKNNSTVSFDLNERFDDMSSALLLLSGAKANKEIYPLLNELLKRHKGSLDLNHDSVESLKLFKLTTIINSLMQDEQWDIIGSIVEKNDTLPINLATPYVLGPDEWITMEEQMERKGQASLVREIASMNERVKNNSTKDVREFVEKEKIKKDAEARKITRKAKPTTKELEKLYRDIFEKDAITFDFIINNDSTITLSFKGKSDDITVVNQFASKIKNASRVRETNTSLKMTAKEDIINNGVFILTLQTWIAKRQPKEKNSQTNKDETKSETSQAKKEGKKEEINEKSWRDNIKLGLCCKPDEKFITIKPYDAASNCFKVKLPKKNVWLMHGETYDLDMEMVFGSIVSRLTTHLKTHQLARVEIDQDKKVLRIYPTAGDLPPLNFLYDHLSTQFNERKFGSPVLNPLSIGPTESKSEEVTPSTKKIETNIVTPDTKTLDTVTANPKPNIPETASPKKSESVITQSDEVATRIKNILRELIKEQVPQHDPEFSYLAKDKGRGKIYRFTYKPEQIAAIGIAKSQRVFEAIQFSLNNVSPGFMQFEQPEENNNNNNKRHRLTFRLDEKNSALGRAESKIDTAKLYFAAKYKDLEEETLRQAASVVAVPPEEKVEPKPKIKINLQDKMFELIIAFRDIDEKIKPVVLKHLGELRVMMLFRKFIANKDPNSPQQLTHYHAFLMHVYRIVEIVSYSTNANKKKRETLLRQWRNVIRHGYMDPVLSGEKLYELFTPLMKLLHDSQMENLELFSSNLAKGVVSLEKALEPFKEDLENDNLERDIQYDKAEWMEKLKKIDESGLSEDLRCAASLLICSFIGEQNSKEVKAAIQEKMDSKSNLSNAAKKKIQQKKQKLYIQPYHRIYRIIGHCEEHYNYYAVCKELYAQFLESFKTPSLPSLKQ